MVDARIDGAFGTPARARARPGPRTGDPERERIERPLIGGSTAGVLGDLITCQCEHGISDHGRDGCERPECPCSQTADDVLECAVSAVRTHWGG